MLHTEVATHGTLAFVSQEPLSGFIGTIRVADYEGDSEGDVLEPDETKDKMQPPARWYLLWGGALMWCVVRGAQTNAEQRCSIRLD